MSDVAAAPVLEARNIAHHFGAVTALADASLKLYPREVVGLVGDSGAGKSTLLLAAVLLDRIRGGDAYE